MRAAWLLPFALVAVGCFDGLQALAPFPCGADKMCPDGYACADGVGCVATNECDVLAPSCSGDHDKCTIVKTADLTSYATCVTPTGDAGVGAACSRTAIGADDCAPDLFCNLTLSPDGNGACRSFCAQPSDCPSGFSCADVFAPLSDGICVPACTPGDATCVAGHSCRVAGTNAVDACTADGTVTIWNQCTTSQPCGHNLVCTGTDANPGECVGTCGPHLSCASGQSCRTVNADLGICQCQFFAMGCPGFWSCRAQGNTMGAFGECAPDGSAGLGADCSNAECARNLTCWGSTSTGYTCHGQCDATHACVSGTCTQLPGLDNFAGVCL